MNGQRRNSVRPWSGWHADTRPIPTSSAISCKRFTSRCGAASKRFRRPIHSARGFIGLRHGRLRVHEVIVVGGTLYVMVQVSRRGARTLPSDAGLRSSLEFHRMESERQRDALRSEWRWCLLPSFRKLVAMLAGAALEHSYERRIERIRAMERPTMNRRASLTTLSPEADGQVLETFWPELPRQSR